MAHFIDLSKENIEKEHICCAISDKKCADGYQSKKDWLKKAFEEGYVFRRLNERAKVFIEYGPAEKAWLPIIANDYININCFWVSGKYKKNGYGKALLQSAIDDAKKQGKSGLVTVVGTKKYHFMSDTKWLIKQGFETIENIQSGFSLLALKFKHKTNNPSFKDIVKAGECPDKHGIVVYYSNRCPFTEYHINESLKETATKRNLPLKVIKINTMEEAQNCPSPATIFSLFLNGKFVTTDISVCMDSRFDKLIEKTYK